MVAAPTLEEGVAWVEARMGVAMGPGGQHALMGTHNRLLSLGPGRYLEVIAIDPRAPAPARPRWFALDSAAMRERLAGGPALVHWVARCTDLEAALRALDGEAPEVLPMTRGEFRWRIGVARDGAMPLGGIGPTLIRWDGRHPADVLTDSGCRLVGLALRHPAAAALLQRLRAAGLSPGEPVEAHDGRPGLAALIQSPSGAVRLGE